MHELIQDFLGCHVTVLVPPSNVGVSVENNLHMFSGKLLRIRRSCFILQLYDGTRGLFNMSHCLGIIENEVLSENDPRYPKGVDDGKEEGDSP